MSEMDRISYSGIEYGGALASSSSFKLASPFEPSEDQRAAIGSLRLKSRAGRQRFEADVGRRLGR